VATHPRPENVAIKDLTTLGKFSLDCCKPLKLFADAGFDFSTLQVTVSFHRLKAQMACYDSVHGRIVRTSYHVSEIAHRLVIRYFL